MVYPGTSVSCLHDSNHTAEGEEEGEELVCAFATGVAHGSHKMLFPEKPESFFFLKEQGNRLKIQIFGEKINLKKDKKIFTS